MEILSWYSLPLMHYKRNEKTDNSHYQIMEFLLQLRHV